MRSREIYMHGCQQFFFSSLCSCCNLPQGNCKKNTKYVNQTDISGIEVNAGSYTDDAWQIYQLLNVEQRMVNKWKNAEWDQSDYCTDSCDDNCNVYFSTQSLGTFREISSVILNNATLSSKDYLRKTYKFIVKIRWLSTVKYQDVRR